MSDSQEQAGATHEADRLLLPSPSGWIDVLSSRYGQMAFGVILLLIVWKLIAEPQVQRGQYQTEKLEAVAKTMAETAQTNADIAKTLQDTTRSLVTLSQVFERSVTVLSQSIDELKEIRRSGP